MTAADNKYELPGVTDLVRGFLLNSGANRVPRPLHVCILYELVLVIRIHIMQTGCTAKEGVHQQRDSFPLRGIQKRHFYKTYASALSGLVSVYRGYPVGSSDRTKMVVRC